MTETKNIWVFIEVADGKVADVSLELLAKGGELAQTLGGQVWGLLCGHQIETLAQIAVSVNHEINNPLCSISANAEMLRTTIDSNDDMVLRKIDIILKEVDRIKQVIRKLSNATRVISMEYISGVKMLDLDKSARNNENKP